MLANVKDILLECKKEKTATGAFNVCNLEMAQAVVNAAISTKKNIIIQITERTLEYAGDVEIVNLVKNIIEQRSGKIKIGVNLDHGRSFKICKKALELGFTGIMIDGSQLSFEENKNLTKKVVDYAQKYKVTVQGELGTVPYMGKHMVDGDDEIWEQYMTNPAQAREFVNYTGIDTLAVAIGNAHGFQKEKDMPDWRRLKRIDELVKTPLILHGASNWTAPKVKKAVQRGITCFNIDTDIRVAFMNKLCNLFEKGCAMNDPRAIMASVRDVMQAKVEEKIKMFSQS